jgi:predicted urease superfamily metal-dependent hydrolase
MKDKDTSTEVTELENEMQQVLKNRQDDYEYSRELMYAAAERLQDILDSAVQLAQESEHPRAIEVATNTAEALGNVAGKMMDHHIRLDKLNNPKGTNPPVTNNNVNVKLNTKDLLELLGRE